MYATPLSAQQVRAHHELGRGRSRSRSEGARSCGDGAAAPAARVREVQFLVDEVLVGRDDAAPYSVTWDTARRRRARTAGTGDRAVVDDHEREATTASADGQVDQRGLRDQQAQLTAATALPDTLVHGSGPCQAAVGVRVKNTGDATIATAPRSCVIAGSARTGRSTTAWPPTFRSAATSRPGAERTLNVTVRPSGLPRGPGRSRMTCASTCATPPRRTLVGRRVATLRSSTPC